MRAKNISRKWKIKGDKHINMYKRAIVRLAKGRKPGLGCGDVERRKGRGREWNEEDEKRKGEK